MKHMQNEAKHLQKQNKKELVKSDLQTWTSYVLKCVFQARFIGFSYKLTLIFFHIFRFESSKYSSSFQRQPVTKVWFVKTPRLEKHSVPWIITHSSNLVICTRCYVIQSLLQLLCVHPNLPLRTLAIFFCASSDRPLSQVQIHIKCRKFFSFL